MIDLNDWCRFLTGAGVHKKLVDPIAQLLDESFETVVTLKTLVKTDPNATEILSKIKLSELNEKLAEKKIDQDLLTRNKALIIEAAIRGK